MAAADSSDEMPWEKRLTRLVRATLERTPSVGMLPPVFFEGNARKIRFPGAGKAGEDITVQLPDEEPKDMQSAASEIISEFERTRRQSLADG